MYNTTTLIKKLEIFKKKLIYRASYRGTKEMDILLGSFVNKYINQLDEKGLVELEDFLNFEDEIIINYYNHDIVKKKINENRMSIIFKKHKV
jgi:antitoxin CptB